MKMPKTNIFVNLSDEWSFYGRGVPENIRDGVLLPEL